MGLTLAQQRAKLRRALGLDTNDELGTDTEIDLLLNTAWWEIADAFDFREKETSRTYNTVAGTIAYSAAADLLGLQNISIEDPDSGQHTPLTEITIYDYETNYVDQISTRGKPTHYVRKGSQVLLYPTPDAIYEIKEDYWKTLADIAVGGVTIPQAWHAMIWMNAAFYGYMEAGDLNRAVGYRKLVGLPSVSDTKETTETKEKENRPYAALQMLRPKYP